MSVSVCESVRMFECMSVFDNVCKSSKLCKRLSVSVRVYCVRVFIYACVVQIEIYCDVCVHVMW